MLELIERPFFDEADDDAAAGEDPGAGMEETLEPLEPEA